MTLRCRRTEGLLAKMRRYGIDACFKEDLSSLNQEFGFGHLMFGMSIRHLSGDTDWVVVHMSQEFTKQVRNGDGKLDLVNVLVKFRGRAGRSNGGKWGQL